jgi:hypothetical protein
MEERKVSPEEARNNVVAAAWVAIQNEPDQDERMRAVAIASALTTEERELLSTMVVERVIRAIVAAQTQR